MLPFALHDGGLIFWIGDASVCAEFRHCTFIFLTQQRYADLSLIFRGLFSFKCLALIAVLLLPACKLESPTALFDEENSSKIFGARFVAQPYNEHGAPTLKKGGLAGDPLEFSWTQGRYLTVANDPEGVVSFHEIGGRSDGLVIQVGDTTAPAREYYLGFLDGEYLKNGN